MPRIFDNIELPLLDALQETLRVSERSDLCVGYFNLRGWKQIDRLIDEWAGGEGACCRLLVGMQRLPQDEVREALSLSRGEAGIDQQTVLRLKKSGWPRSFRNSWPSAHRQTKTRPACVA